MPVYRLSSELAFPDPREAEPGGLLAAGGDLGTERLLLAYSLGIFPWHGGPPILWYSPDPRAVLRPAALHLSAAPAAHAPAGALRAAAWTRRSGG